MKKIIASIVAIVFLAAFVAVGVSAAEFVKSPDKNTVTVASATLNGQNVTLSLISYSGRDALTAEEKTQLEAAYQAIVDDAVTAIPANYKVGALYDLSYDGEVNGTITVAFNADFGNANIKVIYENVETGAWDVAESSYENGVITAKFEHLCPVAILVEDASVIVSDPSEDSPQTGDAPSTAMMVVGSLIVFGGAVAAVFMRKRENA